MTAIPFSSDGNPAAPPSAAAASAASPPAAAPASTKRELAALWASAAAVAALGAAIAYDARPGINWGLWTLAASLGLARATRRRRGVARAEVIGPLVLACVLAFGAAVTADPFFDVLIFVGTAGLLALSLLLATSLEWRAVGAAAIVFAPLLATKRVCIEAIDRGVEGMRALTGARATPAMRGVMIALPVVAILALLLSGADPTLAAWRTSLAATVGSWTIVPRLIFFLVLGTVVVGAFGAALRERVSPPRTATAALARRLPTLGDVERLIALGSVATLFALFFVLQLSYLFGNAPAVHGSGITYAEYAHRGFVELTIAATLTGLLIVGLDHLALRGEREDRVRLVSFALIILVELLLRSAYGRVRLYERAYGFTDARLFAQTYMIVVSLTLITLGYEAWLEIDVRRLARRVVLLAALAVVALAYWNHDAWIAQRNLDRYAATGKLDVRYLTRELSPDAVPTVVASLPRLAPDASSRVVACLRAHYAGDRMTTRADRWFEWSARRAQAAGALRGAGIAGPGIAAPPSRSASCSSAELGVSADTVPTAR